MTTDFHIAKVIANCYGAPNFSKYGVESRIESRGFYQIVGTRGTTNVRDWIRNLFMIPVPVAGLGWVHAGFYIPARLSFKALAKRLNKSQPVYFGGHSKGGPESLLYAHFAKSDGFKVARAITLGAPQFISKSGAKQLRFQIRQYKNGGDPVTGMPANWLSALGHATGLRHIGNPTAPSDWERHHPIGFYLTELRKLEGRK